MLVPIGALSQESQYAMKVDTANNKQQVDYNLTTENMQLLLQKEQINNTKDWLTFFIAISTIFIAAIGILFPIFFNSKQKLHEKGLEKFQQNLSTCLDSYKQETDRITKDLENQLNEFQNTRQEAKEQRKDAKEKLHEIQKITAFDLSISDAKEKLEQITKDTTIDTKKQNQIDANNVSNDEKHSDFIAIWKKSLLLYCSDKHDEAATSFQRLLDNHSGRLNVNALSDIYRLISVCYLINNDNDRALSFSESAVYLNPNNYYAWNCKGVALDTFGKKKDALKCFENSIKICAKIDNVWYNKAAVLDDLNKKSEALIALDRSLELNQNYDLSLILKGCILHSSNKEEEAEKYFNKIDVSRIAKSQMKEAEKVFRKYNLQNKYLKFFKERIK
jgi:tetratricopeptide (TPR) repeat protein